MRSLDLTPSGVIGTILVFVVAATCIRLGIWQLDRRGQRLERNAAVAERLDQPIVQLSSLPGDTAGLLYRRAQVRGTFDGARTLVLAGRSLGGTPGVHILGPLRVGNGAVLVNRGWLPSRDAATVELTAVATDSVAAVAGVLLPFPEVEGVPPPNGFRTTWFRLDGDAVRGQFPYPVAPLYLQLEGDGTGAGRGSAGDAVPVPLPPPTLGAGPHLSYALQWFSFAAIFVVGWAALVMRRGRPAAGTSGDA